MDASLLPALYDALIVAQTSSVGEAAKRLHKTPSAISQQLRRIEEHYGVALFEKAGRHIRPSRAGEAVLGAMTRVFDEAASLEALLEELAGGRVPTLRVAASDYLGEALLIPVMRRLAKEQVALHFEIITTNSTEAMRLVGQGLADVAMISTDREAAPNETSLLSQPFFWVAPREGRARSATARLGREPLLRLAAGSRGRRLLDEYLGRTGARPPSTIDLPSVSLMVSYASQGLGIGLAPGLAVEGVDRTRVLVERAEVPDLDVRLVVRPALERPAPVASFLERLAAEGRRAAGRLAALTAGSS